MHVVLTSNFSPWSRYRGGGQRSTHQLACALSARGLRVTVIFTKPPWEHVEVPHELPYRVIWAALFDVVSRRAAPLRPLSAFSVARALRVLRRTDPPSVVHAQGEEGALARAAAGCPLILTPRYPSYPSLHGMHSWLTNTKYHLLRLAARDAAFVCPTSRASASEVQVALGCADTRVVPNGVDPVFLQRAREPGAERGPLLFFGRIERSKGIDVLLQAFARSSARKLCIVGEGEELAWVRQQALDRVELRGWASAEELSSLLARAALAVLPSREESFGNAMVEAMAMGTPLITTDAGSLPELIEHAVTGWLVPAGEVEPLTQAIDGLLADPARAESLGRAGRAHVLRSYSWDAVAATYEGIYREACEA